jgi:hypothetical protein
MREENYYPAKESWKGEGSSGTLVFFIMLARPVLSLWDPIIEPCTVDASCMAVGSFSLPTLSDQTPVSSSFLFLALL